LLLERAPAAPADLADGDPAGMAMKLGEPAWLFDWIATAEK
jgi:hypothetical protein